MSCVEAFVEPGRKRVCGGVLLAGRKVPEVPGTLVEGESMSLLEAKSQVCQFLATRYLADLEEFPAAAPEEVESVDMLAGNLECQAIWYLADLMGGPDIGV